MKCLSCASVAAISLPSFPLRCRCRCDPFSRVAKPRLLGRPVDPLSRLRKEVLDHQSDIRRVFIGLKRHSASCRESTPAFSSLCGLQEALFACPIHLVSNRSRAQAGQIRKCLNRARRLQGQQCVVQGGHLNRVDALAAWACERSREIVSLEKGRLQAVPCLSASDGDEFFQRGVWHWQDDVDIGELGAEPLHVLEIYLRSPGEEWLVYRKRSSRDLNLQDPVSSQGDAAPIATTHLCISLGDPFVRPVQWLTGKVGEISCCL